MSSSIRCPVSWTPDKSLGLHSTQKDDIFAYRGRHFGRAIHAFINVSQLITTGGIIEASIGSGDLTEEELSAE